MFIAIMFVTSQHSLERPPVERWQPFPTTLILITTNYLAEITWSGPGLYGAGENQTYTYWLLVSTSWKLREKLLGAVEYTQPDLSLIHI